VKRAWCAVAAVGLVLGFAAGSSAGDLKLEIRDGRVTLDARDVPVRQILAEWGRVGHTRVVNGEKVPGGPVTIQLKDVPERQALETLLRSITGYLAAPRAQVVANASIYDCILVMPTVRTASVASGPAAPDPTSRFRAPVNMGRPMDDQEDMFQANPNYPGPQPGMPAGAYPGPGMVNPATPTSMPGAYVPPQQQGVAGPGPGGMMTSPAAPTQPGVSSGGAQVPGVVVQPPAPPGPPKPPGID
jgi:hypothetical protein